MDLPPNALPSSPVEESHHKRAEKLKLMLKRQIEKVKVPRRARSPKNTNESDDDDRPTKYERLERVVRRQLTRGKAARQKFQELRLSHKKRRLRGDGYASETGSRRSPAVARRQDLVAKDDHGQRQRQRRADDREPVVYPRDFAPYEDDDDDDDDDDVENDDYADDDDDDDLENDDDDDDDDVGKNDDDTSSEDDFQRRYNLGDSLVPRSRRRVGRAAELKVLYRASVDVRVSSFGLALSIAVFALLIAVNLLEENEPYAKVAGVAALFSVALNVEAFRKKAVRFGAKAACGFERKTGGRRRRASSSRGGVVKRRKSSSSSAAAAAAANASASGGAAAAALPKNRKRSGSASTLTSDSPRTPTPRDVVLNGRKKKSRSRTLPPPLKHLTDGPPPASPNKKSTRSLSPRSRALHFHVPLSSSERREDEKNTWSRVPASRFALRGPNYAADRLKQPSPTSIYEPVDMHVYDARGMSDVFQAYPDLLAALGDQQKTPTSQRDAKKTLPTYLGLTLNVPKEAPSMRGFWPGSPCYTIVCVFKLSDDAKRATDSGLQSHWPNAYKLLANWLDTADKDPAMNGRLKGIFFCRPSAAPDDAAATNAADKAENNMPSSSSNPLSSGPGGASAGGRTGEPQVGPPENNVFKKNERSRPSSATSPEKESLTPPLKRKPSADDSAVSYEAPPFGRRSLARASSIDGVALSSTTTTDVHAHAHAATTTNHSGGSVGVGAGVDNDDDDEAGVPQRSLPRILQKWNGKPVLMAENATGFSRHRKGISKITRGPNYVEVCINVGESFSYMGRGAVYVMLGKLANLAVDVCFTIEGRANDELPEAVLGCLNFNAMNLHDKFKELAANGR